MTILSQIPEALKQTISWKTDIIKAYDGTEQRINLRRNPRNLFTASYLADTDAAIQFWKYELTFAANGLNWGMPLWGEILEITNPISATATVVNCDFSLTDTALGQSALLIHPDGSNELILCNTATRTDTAITLSSGLVINDYPEGSLWVPVDYIFLKSNPGYREGVYATAQVNIIGDSQVHKVVDAYGATPLTMYNSRPVLDKVPEYIGSNEVFAQTISRTDYGGKVRITSGEGSSHSTISRRYIYTSAQDRQWWKLFLSTAKGQQQSFYTSTYRQDMTLDTQPAQGASTMVVDDASNPAGGWEALAGHQDLALTTADGTIQYVAINSAGTVDNGNGTHTVAFTPALTNTPLGSTIQKISFFELVRLASDDIVIDYMPLNKTISMSTRAVKA